MQKVQGAGVWDKNNTASKGRKVVEEAAHAKAGGALSRGARIQEVTLSIDGLRKQELVSVHRLGPTKELTTTRVPKVRQELWTTLAQLKCKLNMNIMQLVY